MDKARRKKFAMESLLQQEEEPGEGEIGLGFYDGGEYDEQSTFKFDLTDLRSGSRDNIEYVLPVSTQEQY